MAHNITNTDTLLLANRTAWHGLGTVLPDTFGIDEALSAGRLDWEVHLVPMMTVPIIGGPQDGANLPIPEHRATVRSDTNAVLGVVGSKYSVLNNRTMLEVASEAVSAMGGNIKLESCGSFSGGRKVFACIRTNTFDVAKGDTVNTYALLSNSHDGTASFELMNTSVRVVCNNTLNIALRSGSNKARRRHTVNMLNGVPQLVRELVAGKDAAFEFEATAKALASKSLTVAQASSPSYVQSLYEKVYIHMFGKPDTTSATNKALARMADWQQRFFNERQVLGNSADFSHWSLLNSITEWSDHNRTVRNESEAGSRRMLSNLYGSSAELKDKALEAVLAL
jgi:phage/plasmid-like protein (TIGR03299 family)